MIAIHDFPPPARYDHPCTGLCTVLIEPLDRVRKSCAGVHPFSGDQVYACSWVPKKGSYLPCTIVLPTVDGEITQADQDMLLREERANCNGWPKGKRR
jgi:hypothetical protein